MPLLKRKPTPAPLKINLTESDSGKDVDSDEASTIADIEREETEEHGDFINDDPTDSDYEPSSSSATASTEQDPTSPTRVSGMQAQIEMLIAQNKSLEHRVQQLLDVLEQKQK